MNMQNNKTLSRRKLLKSLGLGLAASSSLAFLNRVQAAEIPHIVIVGGGFAGATVAKYLKMWGGLSVQVTIIEPNSTYVSPILSNLVLNGQKTTDDLSFNYVTHNQKYAINLVHKKVAAVDKGNKTLTLNDATTLNYDKLVLAPGIDFDFVNDYDINAVPHAWQAGEQTNLLKAQIDAMQDGDSFVMTIPVAPYRCPPGPYERACVVADYLKNTKGFSNCSVTVLDANAGITVEAETFGNAFQSYGVNYIANAEVTAVNSDTRTVSYIVGGGTQQQMSATSLNVIPNQKAGQIIFDSGLNTGNWAPINPLSYESTKHNDIHIIGDSQGTGMPKAGHIANSEAKICADAILRILQQEAPDPAPKTNSACYSPISSNTASWLTAVYEYNVQTGQMQLVEGANYPASGAPSRDNYSEMFNWSGNLFADTFA